MLDVRWNQKKTQGLSLMQGLLYTISKSPTNYPPNYPWLEAIAKNASC